MKKVLIGFLVIFCPLFLIAQNSDGNYNPYVGAGNISPAPLLPVEANGTGIITFNVGNSGSDPLEVFSGHNITLTISLSNGEPDNADPILALGGSSKDLFSWTYTSGTYTGIQVGTIPASSGGTITIDYKVTQNSSSGSPSNGFNVNLTPAPYQTTSNTQNDDAASSYTWTELKDYGDAPASYGSADHIIDFTNYLGSTWDGEAGNQPSAAADADDLNGIDDEDGVALPIFALGASVNIDVTVTGFGFINCWIDWNGDGDFADAAEQVAASVFGMNQTVSLPVTVPSDANNSSPTFVRVRYNNTPGAPSTGSVANGEVEDYMISIGCTTPSTPIIGTLVQPTCALATGSVTLDGLPATGTWTLTRIPGSVITTGTGTSTTISDLAAGTYTYTVENSEGCTSLPSADIIINTQPAIPEAPLVGTIIHPTCAVATGSVLLSGLPVGTWTLTRSPGSVTTLGSGSSSTVTGIPAGTFSYTVTSDAGCISLPSLNVTINTQPSTPSTPDVGAITQPTCALSTGSVVLGGLPPIGIWTINPGTITGTGTTRSISGLATGTYNFTVTNADGCTSVPSADVAILDQPPTPTAPVQGSVTHPTCSDPTGTVVLNGLPPTGTWTVNPGSISGSGTSTTVTGLTEGTYNFTVTNSDACISDPSSDVIINPQPLTPVAPAVGMITHPTCDLATGSVLLSGLPPTGTWTINPGTITGSGTSTTVSSLATGTYNFTVTNSDGCTSVPSGSVVIDAQPPSPASPIQSIDCSLGFDNAVVTVSSPTGAEYEYSMDGGSYQASTSFTGVSNGTHNITVRNSSGCTTTGPGFNVSCGCVNPPTLSLSSISGNTCGTSPITVSANTFGGTATSVAITDNGAGVVTPGSSSTSPFSFTYTPAAADAGKIVIITVSTNNPLGAPCAAATATYTLTVNEIPAAPSISSISQPTCTEGTGSVVLSGLPSVGTWTLTRTPGNITSTGTGSGTTITGLLPDTYTYTVTSEEGCVSPSSAIIVVNDQPVTPTAPTIGTITIPTCNLSTGSVILEGLPSSGTWTVNGTPGGITSSGTGLSTTISAIPAGTYTFTVTSSEGCISTPSASVLIPAQPTTPIAPIVGTITPPTCSEATGSVLLTGLPSTGTWILTRYSGGITTSGTGSSTTISGLLTGIYNFTVTNEEGCESSLSSNVDIPAQPPTPTPPIVGIITHPTCELATGSVFLSGLPSTGTWTLTRSPGGTITTGSGSSTTISGLESGEYTFTVTNADGCISGSSMNIVIDDQPETPSAPIVGTITHPTCATATGSVVLSGLPAGTWTLTRLQGGNTTTGSGSGTTITGLPSGTYNYTVTSSVGCVSLPSTDIVINDQPPTPTPPLVGATTQPTCDVASGSVVLSGLPLSGTWTLTRSPGGNTITGTGSSTTISGLLSDTYTFTLTNSDGCISSSSDNVYILEQPDTPTAPTVGTITEPTCNVSTGSVVLNGLPSTGTWTLTRTQGGITTSGTGSSTTVTGLNAGTYTFTVANSSGCISPISADVVIPDQPDTPLAPTVGAVTAPTCINPTGSVVLSGLPATGTWTLMRYPGTVVTVDEGTSYTLTGLPTGIYNYSVTNADGCTSATLSDNVVIPAQPPTPDEPSIGSITQPTCALATGSVLLSDLPSVGTWTLTRSPDGIITTGTGTSTTISGLSADTYTFTVTNTDGCTSLSSASIVIDVQPPTPSAPSIGSIIQPTCSEATGSVAFSGLPATGSWTLTRTPGSVTTSGSGTSTTVTGLPAGTFSFTVTNSYGCISGSSSSLVINDQPPLPESPSQSVDCSLGFGNARVTVLSPIDAGYMYSLDGGLFQSATSFTGVSNGTHSITVMNSFGCTITGNNFDVTCGCANPPTVSLSSSSGSTCGLSSVTISGNTFGGSATSVNITENGAGSVSPASSGSSPFSFTYTPSAADAGDIVTISVTTNNPLGSPCAVATATYLLTVNNIPSTPSVGTITHPTCIEGTGSVVLSGLPSTGTWTLTRTPGNVTINGTGTSSTVTELLPGSYTFTVTNSTGCVSLPTSSVQINTQPATPSAPVVGTITQPTCVSSTGSVILLGLPSTGTWTIMRTPGSVTQTGTGTSATISTISAGTYMFTVTNSLGCVSVASANVVITAQPPTPTAPSVGTISPPTCSAATGSVVLLGLPTTGIYTITQFPGTVTTTGNGSSMEITGLAGGTYNFTVTSAAGCLSLASSNVVMPEQPPTPLTPIVGTITQPTFTVPTGSVVLSGLPSSGTWILNRSPGGVTTSGTGSSSLITGLDPGVYSFSVTNASGCVSSESDEVIISTPGVPDLIITDPDPVCFPETVDLTISSITEGSTPGLTYTYWNDSGATNEYATPTEATEGTYYIKGTTVSGYFDIKPVLVSVDQPPSAFGGPDQLLYYVFETTMDADIPQIFETGAWSLVSGTGEIADTSNPKTDVTELSLGENLFLWRVVNGVCPPALDYIRIEVQNLIIPTLITPNQDGRNDYFVLGGLASMGNAELVVFDRRGLQVYHNPDYDNTWDGTDYNGNPLEDDTYFYVLKTDNNSISGYIVIRR